MKTIKNPKSHKKLFIILAVLIVVAGAGTAYAAIQKIGPFNQQADSATEQSQPNDINHSPPTDEQIEAGEEASEQKDPTPPSDTDPGTAPDNNPAPKRQAEVMIDSTNQTGTILKVRASINTIDTDSKCTATLTRGRTTSFNETVSTQTMPSYSMCKGFDIPVGSLAKGAWDLKIVFESKNFKGETLQEVTVQ